jgi:ketosteroid isomerase-like protein
MSGEAAPAVSQTSGEAVRHPLTLAADSSRRLEERLFLRAPYLQALAAQVWSKQPPRSRLRQAIVPRLVRQGFEAVNRRDYDVAFANYDPDIEFLPPTGLALLDKEASYRGLEARIRYEQEWRSAWGDYRYEPEELTDLGDRLLVIGRIKSSSGLSSGTAIDSDWADIFTLSAGRVVREEAFLDRAKAIETAGLSA